MGLCSDIFQDKFRSQFLENPNYPTGDQPDPLQIPVLLDMVQCSGYEPGLEECFHDESTVLFCEDCNFLECVSRTAFS